MVVTGRQHLPAPIEKPYIKTQRLRWYCHIKRMGEQKVVKKVTEWKLDIRRARGRPKLPWEEQVLEDVKWLRIHNWREKI